MYNTKISEVMSRDLTTVTTDTLMDTVQNIFATNYFNHLPVIDKEGKLKGMISKQDYLPLLDNLTVFLRDKKEVQNQRFLSSLLVSDVMTKQVVTLKETDYLSKAADIFSVNLFHAIPIVDEANVVVGILTTYDMITYAYSKPVFLIPSV